MKLQITLKHFNGRFITINKVSSILTPFDHSVMFIGHKFSNDVNKLLAVSDCIVFVLSSIELSEELKNQHIFFPSENPRKEFGRFLEEHHVEKYPETIYYLQNGAMISHDAIIGSNVEIAPFAFIDQDVIIGDNCTIHGGVRILPGTRIGSFCEIHENSVIGTVSLAYEDRQRIPQVGGVVIGDHVSLGANSVVCRGAIDNTTVGDNCIIDSMCYISHNNCIGEESMMIAGSMTFGSVTIGKQSYISGQSVIKNQVSLGEKVTIGMGSVVIQNVPSGKTVFGNPARILRTPDR